jgi:DNA-binding response OmpR family regulator
MSAMSMIGSRKFSNYTAQLSFDSGTTNKPLQLPKESFYGSGQADSYPERRGSSGLPRPDITLMDLRLPGCNGTDSLIAIRGELPQARIIMLTTSDSDGDIQRALRAGASAYILKSMPTNELLGVIRSVHAGRRHIPPEVAARLAETWVTTTLRPGSWRFFN